ncbi:MAG: TlpA disulfide reductase family protein [Pyrinomonadaceae bacterium]
MSLKSFVLLFITVTAITGTSCTTQKVPTFSLTGDIANYKGQSIVLSQEEDINRKQNRVIGNIAVDDKGHFDVAYDLEPHIYTLNFDGKTKVAFAVGKGQKVLISGDANVPTSIKARGAPDTEKLAEYEAFRKESLNRLVVSVRDQIKALKEKNTPETDPEMVRLSGLEIDNYIKHKDELMKFVEENMGTSIAVYAASIRWDGDKHMPFLESLAKAFEKDHPGLAITKKLKEKVDILRGTSIGGTVPDIKMPDKDGREVSLSSLKGKYILIDFWASWCAPCRAESRDIVALYEQYKNKGFDIYGVGLESEKQNWLNAIEADKRSWANVSTFQEFETPIAFEYGITSLPANFVVDADRKIVAKNLHGDELRATIEKLFSQ